MRFAMFTHAIRSTQPAAPIKTRTANRVLPSNSSRSGTTTAPRFRLLANFSSNLFAIADISTRARSSVTPNQISAASVVNAALCACCAPLTKKEEPGRAWNVAPTARLGSKS